MDKLLHHVNVIKINYANTVTNTVKHTLSIIISLLFSLDLSQKPSQKRKNMKRNFFSKYVYYSPTIELKDNRQTIHVIFFTKLNLVRLFGLINVLEK